MTPATGMIQPEASSSGAGAPWHLNGRIAQALRGLCLTALIAANPASAFDTPANPLQTKQHTFTGTVEAAFSPWDDAEALLRRAISEARHDIYVQIYLFTSRPVADALIAARERGVRVQVLADAQNVAGMDSSQIPRLSEAGIPVALETRHAAAHNKVMLVDPEHANCAVLTGSYNYTRSARLKNAENLLLLKGDMTLARAYLENWRRHRAEASPYSRSLAKEIPSRNKNAIHGPTERLPFPWEHGRSPGRERLEMD